MNLSFIYDNSFLFNASAICLLETEPKACPSFPVFNINSTGVVFSSSAIFQPVFLNLLHAVSFLPTDDLKP